MSIFKKLKLSNKNQLFLVLILCAICLVLVVVSIKNESADKQSFSNEYVNDLEKRLENVLSKIDGVGKVSVVINVESGMETVLAYKKTVVENSSGKQMEETPIIVNGQTVVLKELFPRITGVLVVAQGVDSIIVLTKIQQATTSLLDININQIEILSMD